MTFESHRLLRYCSMLYMKLFWTLLNLNIVCDVVCNFGCLIVHIVHIARISFYCTRCTKLYKLSKVVHESGTVRVWFADT